MSLITWTDSLNIGIEQLDNEHKVLIGIANELFDAMTDGHSEKLVEKCFANLKEHLLNHCHSEELLIQSYEYNNYEDHKKHHESLINALNVLWTKYKQDVGSIDAARFAQFVEDWLIVHIKHDVFEFEPFA